jgi:hypothetical protein
LNEKRFLLSRDWKETMSNNLILSSNESPIQQPYDKYWDSPMTRREAQRLFMKLASNDNELMGMADTVAILINFICEKKLGIVDRTEVDAYVTMKTEQLKAVRAAMKAAADRGENPEQVQDQTQPTPQTAADAQQSAQGQATDAQSNS